MAAPNGMAPRPTNANAMAQMEIFLRQMPVELQAQMQNLPLDQKINFARQYMAAKKAQSSGMQMLQQPQQQQQQPPQRPPMDAQAFAQAQAQAQAQALLGQQQQQQQQQRMQGPPLRPDSIPGYTAEQLKQLSASNPGIQHLLSQITVNGQQVTPASQAAFQQLIQAQAMQNQNHIQPQLQQGLNHPGIPMPRTPNQAQLGMTRGMSNQGPMQHPSSPASFSSPQIQQSPKQGGIGTPQQQNVALGQPNNLAHFNKVAELQNRANGGPNLTPQQMQHVLQSQAMRAQGSNQGQVRPVRPPMQQPQPGVNGQMMQNGQGQGMSVRPQGQSPATAAMMLNGMQGFAGTPSGLAVDRIVDHLQELGDLRDQNALDKTQKEAINTLISNPRVVQDQFVARAAKAQEDRLSVAQQELRNGGVPGLMMMDGQGGQNQAAAMRALQQSKMGQAALAMQQQQMQSQFARQQAAQIGGGTPQSGMNGQGGMMPNGQSSNPMTPGDGQAQSRGSNSGSNTPGGMMSDISQQTGQQFVAKISSFSEEKREEIFRKNPQIRPWYTKQLAQLMQRHHERQLQEVAGHQIAQAQAQDRMLNIGNMQGQMNGIGGPPQNGPPQMPLPNLQLPANRQRNVSIGSNQQQQQPSPQQVALSQAAAIAQQQQHLQAVVAQAQSQIQQQQAMPHSQSQSPGQGTPVSRTNGTLPVPRGSTPNRVMSLQGASNRASPGPNQAGSPSLRQADVKPGMGGVTVGQAPNVADLQARMQGNMPHSYVNGVMQGDAQKTQGQIPMVSQPHTPNIPLDFRPITVQSLVIPEKLTDQETRWPAAPNFPNKLGARPTLSNGLGPGAVLGMPIIESRPSTFKDLIDKLVAKQPSAHGRALRGSLFDRSGHAEEEEVEEERKTVLVEMVVPANEDAVDHEPEGSAIAIPKKRKISEIAKNVDKDLVLSDGVEQFLLEIADELIESVAQAGCRLAKHRKGNRLEVKDLQVHLERDSNIFIPGYAYEAIRVDQAPFLRKTQVPSTRTTRMAALQQAKRDGAPIGKVPVKQAQQA